jgi:Zn-dependent peptidase ImmA (M78 family)
MIMNKSENYFQSALELLLHLKETNGFDIKSPIDVDKIATELGIYVDSDFSLESKDIIGEIFLKEENPIIKINPIQNFYNPRRRFTIAHEIGHYCLHSAKSKKGFVDSQKTMSRTQSYWDIYESEANTFAAQLLMPKFLVIEDGQKVIDEYREKTGGAGIPVNVFIESMAKKFDVSSKAIEYRLKNIGIIKQPNNEPA